jgi:DNA-binding NarL/FixJ family response regulator
VIAAATEKRESNVLIVEDHPMFRERLRELIDKEPGLNVCGEADNIETALAVLRGRASVDVVVLDITLRNGSGLELLKHMKAEHLSTPVLVLSMHDESLYAERSLLAGAKGYLTKYEASPRVMAAIRQVLAGEVCVSTKITAKILDGVTNGHRKLSGIEQLTDRELEVFELIGRGRTTREIGRALRLGTTTIDTYRARIKTKLAIQNSSQLVHEAVRWVEAGQRSLAS